MQDITERRRRRLRLPPLVSCLTVAGLLLALTPAGTRAQDSGDVQQGSEILGAVNGDGRDCADLSDADFEAVGELVMERMLGSARAHAGMDRTMDSMMGEGGLDQMHRFMGQRLRGCGGGAVPGGFGGMMGTMGMMGGMGADSGSGNGVDEGAYGPGMMGQATGDDADDDDNWGGGVAAVMSVMMLALIGVLAYWLLSGHAHGPRRGAGDDARAILDRRLAAGEIEPDEYERRRTALGGSS